MLGPDHGRVLGDKPERGIHAYWLAPDVCGNTKLAQRLATPEELAEKPGDKYRTLIETRGLGGFSVAAPTPGSFHPSGRPWLGDGSPEITSLITAEEREGIFACARKCHKVPKGAIHERPERAKHETLERPSPSFRARLASAVVSAGRGLFPACLGL